MHDVVLQQTVFWIWLILAVAAILFAGFFFVKYLFDGDDQDGATFSIVQLALHASIGLFFASLLCLGHPATALWSWRILSCTVAVTGVGIMIRVRVKPPLSGWKPAGEFAFAGSTILGLFCTVASFLVHAPVPAPLPGGQLASPSAFASWLTADHVNKLASSGALFLLAVLAVYAGFGFLRAVQRRGTLSLERNDAGIGGSSSMWEISPALTFLGAMVLFGALFTVLLFHEEGRATDERRHQEELARSGGPAAAPVPPSAQPAAATPAPVTAPHTTPAEVPAASSH
ncbi:MAG TPA: hypothetical protein VGN16_16220 [Acidobacteriaceae bacterium]|jgi:hypothetical protein